MYKLYRLYKSYKNTTFAIFVFFELLDLYLYGRFCEMRCERVCDNLGTAQRCVPQYSTARIVASVVAHMIMIGVVNDEGWMMNDE